MILNNPSERAAIRAGLTERRTPLERRKESERHRQKEKEKEMAKLGRLMEKNGLDLPKVTHTESAPCL